jgi:hypothetical protein
LVDRLIATDLSELDEKLIRHYLHLGDRVDGPFLLPPWRQGVLLAGATRGGKSTFTTVIIEALLHHKYQFCLIDPEGDYLELPDISIVGNETAVPPPEEIGRLLKDPGQSLVVCTLSVPLADRPEFFCRLLEVLTHLRREYGRPHWLILDEAHHLVPGYSTTIAEHLPADFDNFLLISTSPHALHRAILEKISTIITIGENPDYPFRQVGEVLKRPMPDNIPSLAEGEICVWRRDTGRPPFKAGYQPPRKLRQRHKKKYANGDMGDNSFVFTGSEGRLHLVANNLMLFAHIAEGIDDDTWSWHLHRHDFANWFRDTIHDEELALVAEKAETEEDLTATRRLILNFINSKYTG